MNQVGHAVGMFFCLFFLANARKLVKVQAQLMTIKESPICWTLHAVQQMPIFLIDVGD